MAKQRITTTAKRMQALINRVAASAASPVAGGLAEHIEKTAAEGHDGVGLHDHQSTEQGGLLDHGWLSGLGDDDHTQYLLADGGRALSGHLLPATSDTYDLGAETRLFRKIWASEIDSLIFSENTILRSGGYLMITKNAGSLAAEVDNVQTTVDFGTAMTLGDFVIFRAAGAVEYMQVGALVDGTTYNVTRDLDGTGASAWPAGAPFAVLGQSGDGRIELSAYTTPRIRVIKQGATYDDQDDVIRIGDMNGSFGTTAERYGIGIGDYAGGNYLSYNAEEAGALRLKGGAGGVTFDGEGLEINPIYVGGNPGPGYEPRRSKLRIGGMHIYHNQKVTMPLDTESIIESAASDITSRISLRMNEGTLESVTNRTAVNIYTDRVEITRISGSAKLLLVAGWLYSRIGGVDYKNYINVLLDTPLTSPSWNAAARSTTGPTLIDLSAVFGVPAGVKAVYVRAVVRDSAAWGTGNLAFFLGPSATYYYMFACTAFGGDLNNWSQGWVTCNANGDVYYRVLASGTGTMDVTLEIWGYML